jgi:hypothetical protein
MESLIIVRLECSAAKNLRKIIKRKILGKLLLRLPPLEH